MSSKPSFLILMKKKLHLLWCLLLVLAVNAQQNWTWMAGTGSSTYLNPVYGTQGVSASSNDPGSREFPLMCTDNSGNVWIFGGAASSGYRNDLWKFTSSTGQWTWVSGSTNTYAYGTYGTQGTASSNNIPGCRYGGAMAADNNGNLWLFGGYGYSSSSSYVYLNDLWRYNIASGQWTWMKGSNGGFSFGTYGTTGVAASTNVPGARHLQVFTKDPSGNLWLYGGAGYGVSSSGTLGDLWKFDPSSNNFTYMGGTSSVNQYGTSATLGVGSTSNRMGCRHGVGIAADQSGNIWLYGGYGYNGTGVGRPNDLWKFDPSNSQWTWVSGSNTSMIQAPVYGTQGVGSTSNYPSGRQYMHLSADNQGNLWAYGLGDGYAGNGQGYVHDLWRFTISNSNWAWMKGSQSTYMMGTYGTKGVSASNNTPAGRVNNSASADGSGNIWLFGGYGYGNNNSGQYNDLWRFTVCDAPAPPSITNNTTSLIVCSGNTTTLTATTTSGTILWYASATSTAILGTGSAFTPTGLSAAGNTSMVTIFATGSVACGTSAFRSSITITVNPNPTVTVNSGTACAGAPYILMPSGAATYSYSGGNQVVYPTTSTNYTVTGFSTAGCTNTVAAVASITVSPAPAITVNSGSVCAGASYTINPSGASTYTFSSGSAVVTPTASSFYAVTGTSSLGCVSILPVMVGVAVYNSPTITATGGTVCAGQPYTLSGSGANTYSFSSGSSLVNPSSTTTYSVYGIGVNGCPSQPVAVTVTVPAASTISANSGSICLGDSYTIMPTGANNYTYSSGSAVVTPTTTMSYTVMGVDNGCPAIPATVNVTVIYGPAIAVASGTICDGSSFTLSPSGASTFTYVNGGPVVTPTITSVYPISSEANGCITTINATVLVNPTPTITISDESICLGESYTLMPSGADSYSYSGGTAIVTPTISTTYTISGDDFTGCAASDVTVNITVNNPPTLSPVASATTICAGESVSITVGSAASYVWVNSNSNTPEMSTNTVHVVSPSLPTTYTVNGTSAEGCNASAVIAIMVQACTGITNNTIDELNIWPNPNNGQFNILLNASAHLEVINQLGQVVYVSDIVAGDNHLQLTHLANGLYYAQIRSGSNTHLVKIIKQ